MVTGGDFSDGTWLGVSSPQVIHETIDGEVIVINLGTGSYYSLRDSAAEIWGLIQRPGGVQATALVDALAARFDAPPDQLEAVVRPFLATLAEEELVAPTTGAGEPVAATARWASGGDERKLVFVPPSLEKFTDMQDLVLLDPVHEVDETGWPQRPEVAGGGAGS
jgi:coenzyme PQQ synthesis protein D (PqqD)